MEESESPTNYAEQLAALNTVPEDETPEDEEIRIQKIRDLVAAQEEALRAEANANIEPIELDNTDAAEAEAKRMAEATDGLKICRMVEYRSRTGNYSVPAVVNCTVDSIYQPGVELGYVPALSHADRVHLTVFTPGKPGLRVEADDFVVTSDEDVSENVAGCYQEWNIPYDPNGGPGTWKWPTR